MKTAIRLNGLKDHLAEYANGALTINEIKKIGILHNTNYQTTKILAKKLNIKITR